MRISGRLPGQGHSLRRAAGRALLATFVLVGSGAVAFAREVTVRGAAMKGYGRIELQFDVPTKVKVRAANGVLVVGFDQPARVKSERLAAEMTPYITAVRRDPDDTGLRIALFSALKPNVLEAGERVFIDLLPPTWSGLPPSLPQEVVAELAERASVAERKLREAQAQQNASRRPVTVRLAELPTLTRFVFEPPPGTAIRFKEAGGVMEAIFEGHLALDLAGTKPKVAAGVAEFASSQGEQALTVRLAAAPGFLARGFLEGDTFVADLAKPAAPPPPVAATLPPKTPAGPVPSAPDPERPVASATAPASPPTTAEPRRAAPAPLPGPPSETTQRSPGVVVPVLDEAVDGGSILFPFTRSTAAAAFERGGRVTLVFNTDDRIDPKGSGKGLTFDDVRSESGLAVMRLTLPDGAAIRLSAENQSWRLSIGGRPGLPPGEIPVSRSEDTEGNAQVTVGLPGAAVANWIDQDGSRLAVVTAYGRANALTTPRRLLEFDLLPTVHGVVVAPKADDLGVTIGRAGALISRRAGLTLSAPGSGGEGRAATPLIVDREAWMQDRSGDVLTRQRDLVVAAANASRATKAESHVRLARLLLANGLSHEAAGVLTLARADDAVFAKRRETQLLSGIALLRSGRLKEAREFLASETLADDPEATLWRAALDASERQWPRALAGFRRSGALLNQYPEDVAGALRLSAVGAALEIGDVAAAEASLAALDSLPIGAVQHDEMDLARAKVDEAAGRPDAALKAYNRLFEEAARPVAAVAELRRSALAGRLKQLPPNEAAKRLEILAVAWRGDDVELGALVELARLYAETGKWRDMFATTRRANHFFPAHEWTRILHEETAKRFESLLLGDDADKLSAVETLALYYDYKEFAPIGRRGDEIVRKLADRLVELDLLDQAAELLQHQVDKRLTGAARAAVAARLATIRLMSGKPLLALTALQTTRLAELPAEVRRLRLLLEAQAQADMSRVDLALEILDGEEGVEFSRMRATILFGARRWREAGEACEALLGRRWQGPAPLSDVDRSDVIRAAVSDAMASETIALDRLRTKFAAKMADSPDARTFELLMRPGIVRSPEFRAIMREAGKPDGLRRLLESWNVASGPGGDRTRAEPASAAGAEGAREG